MRRVAPGFMDGWMDFPQTVLALRGSYLCSYVIRWVWRVFFAVAAWTPMDTYAWTPLLGHLCLDTCSWTPMDTAGRRRRLDTYRTVWGPRAGIISKIRITTN